MKIYHAGYFFPGETFTPILIFLHLVVFELETRTEQTMSKTRVPIIGWTFCSEIWNRYKDYSRLPAVSKRLMTSLLRHDGACVL